MFPTSRQAGKRHSRRKPRTRSDFFSLTDSALEHFNNIAEQVAHPGGSVVFKEGSPVNGVYLVCAGEVKLFATASDGHTMILKIARVGDILGLSAALNDFPYEVTAETLVPCSFKHIAQQLFLKFLASHAEAGYLTSLTLAKEHREVFLGARRLALSPSASVRIAQILIGFSSTDANREPTPSFSMGLTHAELASMAGTSRETVTRILNQFERDGIISRENSTITIMQLSQLEQCAR